MAWKEIGRVIEKEGRKVLCPDRLLRPGENYFVPLEYKYLIESGQVETWDACITPEGNIRIVHGIDSVAIREWEIPANEATKEKLLRGKIIKVDPEEELWLAQLKAIQAAC